MNKNLLILSFGLSSLTFSFFSSAATAFDSEQYREGLFQFSLPIFSMISVDVDLEDSSILSEESFLIEKEFFECKFKRGDYIHYRIIADIPEYHMLQNIIAEKGSRGRSSEAAMRGNL